MLIALIIAALCFARPLAMYLWRDRNGVRTNYTAIAIALACLILVSITTVAAFGADPYQPETMAFITAWNAGWATRGQDVPNPYPDSRPTERKAWDAARAYTNWSNPMPEVTPKPRDPLANAQPNIFALCQRCSHFTVEDREGSRLGRECTNCGAEYRKEVTT